MQLASILLLLNLFDDGERLKADKLCKIGMRGPQNCGSVNVVARRRVDP